MNFWDALKELETAAQMLTRAQIRYEKVREMLAEAHEEEKRKVARGEIELRDPNTGKVLRPSAHKEKSTP